MKYKYQEIISTISDEEAYQMIDKVARFIVSRHLAPAGILLIESLHPLHSIGSQALYFILPFAEIIFDSAKYQRFALMIQKEEYIKALVKRIDELDEELNRERRQEARLQRKRRKNKMRENFKNIFKKRHKKS
ncbi:MAG: hypothetical protein RBR69_03620 [Candidatus Cloacimonadaceae bacterium]|nr:hypothetical protein [Candidatus Cloacimonadota bacterium]MDY0127207.1 hypothetical protein [Candidatus Cloacimonadaceae bacterium]MCB5254073.1 hypothetical protein [Candidatus Cloacimonadota bacterium]MCK9179166.1 hypothetical protein [Candidatus Cloacimonadota bacterium]MCK9241709.1 hypothetical protein [Candidatus Cloacimonadota bacterium]